MSVYDLLGWFIFSSFPCYSARMAVLRVANISSLNAIRFTGHVSVCMCINAHVHTAHRNCIILIVCMHRVSHGMGCDRVCVCGCTGEIAHIAQAEGPCCNRRRMGTIHNQSMLERNDEIHFANNKNLTFVPSDWKRQ